MIWIALANIATSLPALLSAAAAPAAPTLSGAYATLCSAFSGFTPAVWGVIVLKALNGLLIPATFKYADNILYSYAKPSSIVATTLFSAAIAGVLPAPSLLIGVALVVASVVLYSSKPKGEGAKAA
jgi:UDP-sugar transporter A1/2/3